MRLFAYYIGHTFINSLKKILKTWVAFMLLFIVLGGLIGFIGGSIAASFSDSSESEIDVIEADDDSETDNPDDTDPAVTDDEDDFSLGIFADFGKLSRDTNVELAISAVFFLILLITLLNGKGLEEVFLPADVPLLFSAPMKPQAVMLFRLCTALGMQIVFSLIMVFQLPNLIHGAGLPLYGAITLILAWAMFTVLTTLLQVLLYLVSSRHENFKKYQKLYIGIFFALIAAGYVFFVRQNGNNFILGAAAMFTGSSTYWIPFWGWFRGFCMNAITGNLPVSFLYLGICLVAFAGMILLVWNMKVDFYEDAMHAAERKAKQLEKANGNKNGLTERTKDRSDRLRREGFHYGKGANVFFYKTLYNRFRFAWFHVLTATMLIYLGLAVLVLVLNHLHDFEGFAFLAVSAAFCAVSFFRTLGNPLADDVGKDFFLMIPAGARAKLFWSLLGGLCNTLLDMIIPYLVAIVCLRPGIAQALLWLVFILSFDLYGTIVNTFILASVSVTLPETVRKMVQILFVYFGLMPAIVVILIGALTHHLVLFLGIGIVLNLGISFLFFMLTPLFWQNGRK